MGYLKKKSRKRSHLTSPTTTFPSPSRWTLLSSLAFDATCKTGLEVGRNPKRESASINEIQDNTLFNINSVLFNLENNQEEIMSKYNCFYNPSLDAMCIMVEKGLKYIDLSKDMIMNFIEFAQNMKINNIVMLLDRKNKDYVKILQSMMTVGFANDKDLKSVKIAEIDYKTLKMNVNLNKPEVEEIDF